VLIWYAWHIWDEVFYNDEFTNYTICTTGENLKCADQFNIVDTNASEHWNYLNVTLPCYGQPFLSQDDEFLDTIKDLAQFKHKQIEVDE